MDPIFLTIGPIVVRWYGVLIMLGVVLGTIWTVRLARARGLDPEWILDLGIWFALAGIVGARAAYVLTSPSAYFGPGGDPLAAFAVWEGGLSIHGAVAGIIAVLAWQARKKGYDAWRYLDVLMPVMAFGIIGGRIGNFMNGTDTGGRLTDWAIGFRWPAVGTPTFGEFGRVVFGERLWVNAPPACFEAGVRLDPCVVHLTQGYGALVGVLLIGVIVWALRSARSHGGVALHAVIWYSVLRSVIEEPFRDNPLPLRLYEDVVGGVGLLTTTQVASVVIVAIGLYLLSARPDKRD
ncbi:MAG: prolipoprotein diacylglyceryl transferase, partial [Trueperaceae bacterium]|nr:prolipoprotein diacylglyceryl transferase [Trueperaceae bacterium]